MSQRPTSLWKRARKGVSGSGSQGQGGLPLQQLGQLGQLGASSQGPSMQALAAATPPSPTPTATPTPSTATPTPAPGLASVPHPLSVLRSQSVPVGPSPMVAAPPPSGGSVVGDVPSGASSVSSSAPHTMSTTASSLGDGGSPLLAPQPSGHPGGGGPGAHPPPHRSVSVDEALRRRPPTASSANAANRRKLQWQPSKAEVVKSFIKRETAQFFGVDEGQEHEQRQRWEDRRRRYAARKYGHLKDDYMTPATTPTAESALGIFGPHASGSGSASGSDCPVRTPRGFAFARSVSSSYPQAVQPDLLPAGYGDGAGAGAAAGAGDDVQDSPRWSEPPVRRKETVARMTFTGIAFVISALANNRPRATSRSQQMSRSYQPSAVAAAAAAAAAEDAAPSGASSPLVTNELFFEPVKMGETRVLLGPEAVEGSGTGGPEVAAADEADSAAPPSAGLAEMQRDGGFRSSRDHLATGPYVSDRERRDFTFSTRDRQQSWITRCCSPHTEVRNREVGLSRIKKSFIDTAFDNSDRREYGMGFMGKICGRSLNGSVVNEPQVKEQLDDIEDHRPFFTYWVTTVQILILIISLASYGLGPIGFSLHERSSQVLVTSLSLQQVEYTEPANFWVGPRAADLIHLGAKFAPCMRKDAKIIKEIEKGREKEKETACCIRNDDSGCVQRTRSECSTVIETFKKWTQDEPGPGGRISGPVCGLDPKYCETPRSVAPFEWPEDITKWPICRKTNSRYPLQRRFQHKDKTAEHMACEVIGHPCCIGIHGACSITTKEYCEFVHGYFHEEASLCSQVSCLDDVCGMIPFYSPEVPDQFYRLWTSLFLHAGLFHLAITVFIQYFLMRDLEKLTGSLRISIIYIGSGVAGNLASAIFVPYRAEVGPAGSQFGLLACLIVEVLNAWKMLRRPGHALMRLVSITILLFLLGLLPWVDNYAHLFGFIFGFLLSYALLPFITIGKYHLKRKIALIWVCLLASSFMFATLVALFYIIPVYDCEVCKYFNCLPITKDFCATQNIILRRHDVV